MLPISSNIIKALKDRLSRFTDAHASIKSIAVICMLIGCAAVLYPLFTKPSPKGHEIAYLADAAQPPLPIGPVQVRGVVREGETLSYIFSRHGIAPEALSEVLAASRDTYNLAMLKSGKPYSLTFDSGGGLISFAYEPQGGKKLTLSREGGALKASLEIATHARGVALVGGVIKDTLSASVSGMELALALSDVFAWELDFATDLRKGDTFRIVVETISRDGRVVGYGNILAAEFVNNGKNHRAYRFAASESSGAEYYDADGNSLKRTFLKAPLSYRRISSGFSAGRFHPVLKKFRAHYAVDYAASAGTPVSAVGDGVVTFADFNGQNGNLVSIRHSGGFATSYGHLQKIASGIRPGTRVKQGQVVGWVGSTGLATGPHLDYRITQSGRPVNPLRLHSPNGKSVPEKMLPAFESLRESMDLSIAAIETGAPRLAKTAFPAVPVLSTASSR